MITLNVRIPTLDTAASGMLIAASALVAFLVGATFWYVALALGF